MNMDGYKDWNTWKASKSVMMRALCMNSNIDRDKAAVLELAIA